MFVLILVIHYIKVVQKDSGASKSGLRVGDRVIEINNRNIENLNHEEIVSEIKKSGKKVVLLVADEWTYKKFTTESVLFFIVFCVIKFAIQF